jgi:GH35 family endo-1,4-beta-xylanase
VDTPAIAEQIIRTFNRVSLSLSWHQVEVEETRYRWNDFDHWLTWAEEAQLDVTAGPLLDFSSAQLPAWLWIWQRDLPSMATFMCRFIEAAVRRYRTRIRRWQITAATNWANVLGLTEEELLGLTFRLAETARQVDPSLELILGISQPWGEYMIRSDRTSPFIFADNLIRTGLPISAINLEVVMGVKGRGSYARDCLDMSRLLDLYALLGVPLHVTLGYPHSHGTDPEADPELMIGAGQWGGEYSPVTQSDWAARFVSLALSKAYVQSVQWTHLSDRVPHVFPNCGLFDANGNAMPTLDVLRQLRETHLV